MSQNVYSPMNSSTVLIMYVGIHGLLGIARLTSLKWEQGEGNVQYACTKKGSEL